MSQGVLGKPSKFRFAAFAGVLLLASGLVLTMFDEARAIEMEFTTAPSSVVGSGTFVVDLTIPQTQRIPIESVIGIIEKQHPDRSDKAESTLVTRAECAMVGTAGNLCSSTTLTKSGPQANAISSITFVNYFAASTGYAIEAAYGYGTGTLTGTKTGYGYDTVSDLFVGKGYGYGYGYKTGNTATVTDGSGQGYGYGSDSLILRFQVVVSATHLDKGTHYLTVLAETGSSILGQFSSPFTQFTAAPGGGAGTGGGGGGGGGDGGGGGAGAGSPITLTAGQVSAPAGATAAFRVTGVTQTAGQTITIQTASDFLGDIVFTPSTALSDATIDVVHYPPDNPPPGVGNIPQGLSIAGFVQITISSGGESHQVTIAVTIPPGQAEGKDSSKAVLIKWDEGENKWVPKGRITLTQNADGSMSGSGSSDCCSDYAVAFDEEDPTVTLSVPSGTLSESETITAEASDNLEVSKVEFYVDDTLVATDTEAPYSYALNTASYENGDHTIRAVAYDSVDNTAESSTTSSFENDEDTTPPGPGGDDGGDGGIGFGTILIILIVLAIIGAAGYYFYQQSQKK